MKSFDVILVSHLTLDDHEATVSKACYFHIRTLRHIRASLPDDTAKMIACSIPSSRLDYYNFLLVCISEINFSKLQLVQNTLARVVTETKRNDHNHITLVLSLALAASLIARILEIGYTGLQLPKAWITSLPGVAFC